MNKHLLSLVIGLVFSAQLVAGSSHHEWSSTIDPSKRYVFYSHGFIVEGDDPKPIHPRWGVYDFPAVKAALSKDNYVLIAHHRAKSSDPFKHVDKLASQATMLMNKGVPAEHIFFVGFSRGGGITALVSDQLKHPAVNFVILAGCSGLIKSTEQAKLYGRVLSIREKTDQVGSCGFLLNRGGMVADFREMIINTGKEHGAFYLPREAWLAPVFDFIEGK